MKMLNKAARLAYESNHEKNFLIACIGKRKDGVFVQSDNSLVKDPSPCQHAEAKVLRKTGKGATLWIARVLRNGTWAMSKPCKNCQKLIRNMNVKKVYYTISHKEYGTWNL